MEYYYLIHEIDGNIEYNNFDKAFKELLRYYLIFDFKCYLIITKKPTKIHYKYLLDFTIENNCTILFFKNYNLISNNRDFIIPPNIKSIFNYVIYLDSLSKDDFNELYYKETNNNFIDKLDYLFNKISCQIDLEKFIRRRKCKLINKKFNLD